MTALDIVRVAAARWGWDPEAEHPGEDDVLCYSECEPCCLRVNARGVLRELGEEVPS